MFDTLDRMGKYWIQIARLMVGIPDYDAYVRQMRKAHPDQPPMSYEAFFRACQNARYSDKNGGFRCW